MLPRLLVTPIVLKPPARAMGRPAPNARLPKHYLCWMLSLPSGMVLDIVHRAQHETKCKETGAPPVGFPVAHELRSPARHRCSLLGVLNTAQACGAGDLDTVLLYLSGGKVDMIGGKRVMVFHLAPGGTSPLSMAVSALICFLPSPCSANIWRQVPFHPI